MLGRVAAVSSSRLSGSLLSFIGSRALVATAVRYQSGGWVAPKRRGQHYQQQRRPLVNGKQIPFHINDLKAASSSSLSSSSSLFGSNSSSTTGSRQQVSPQQQQQKQRRKQYDSDLIVVLDLDECLIHSIFLQNPQEASVYAHQLKQQHHHQQRSDNNNNGMVDSFRVSLPDGELVHVHVRPGLIPFLRHVTSRYETHIFTAAMQVYAKPVLDYLCSSVRAGLVCDRDNSSVFAGRWYRKHCTWDPNLRAYVKDLSKLAALQAPHKTVLVDNNPLSFYANPENGILVNSFYQDASDNTLAAVTEVLADLEDCQDVRPVLTERFQLGRALQTKCAEKHEQASVVQFAEEEEDDAQAAVAALEDEAAASRPQQVACFA